MAWPGWMNFAGTEIINVERTTQYVQKNLTGLSFKNRYGSEGLALALEYAAAGDGDVPEQQRQYESPLVDRPDWFDAANKDTWGFYGFYPTSIEGMEDSTTQTSITELSGDGGVAAIPRETSREIRFSGILVGADEGALTAGMTWLKQALKGSPCASGNCGGETLCFFASAPEPVEPLDLCGPGYVLAEDGTCVPESFYDPNNPYQYTEPIDYGSIPDAHWNALLALGWKGMAGDQAERIYPPAGWPQAPAPGPYGGVAWQTECVNDTMRQFHDVSVLTGPVELERYAPTNGALRRIEFTLVAGDPHVWGLPRDVPDDDHAPTMVGGTPQAPWVVATDRTNEATNPSMEVSATGWAGRNSDEITRIVGPGPIGNAFGRAVFRAPMDQNYFVNAHTPVVMGQTYTSSLYVRSATITRVRTRMWWYRPPVGTAFGGAFETSTSPIITLHPGWNRLSITAEAPNTASHGRASIYMDPGLIPANRINLANNPSSQDHAWNSPVWGTGGSGNLTRIATGGVDDGAFTRMTWLVGSSAGGGIGGVGTENRNYTITANTAYSASIMVRTNRATHLRLRMGGTYGAPVETVPGTWTRLAVAGFTDDTSRVVSPVVEPARAAGTNPWRAGDQLDVDHVLIESGTALDEFGSYFDGNSLGGEWSGLEHASSSLLSPVLDFDALLIERTNELRPYFDGHTPNTKDYLYIWEGNDQGSRSFRRWIAQHELNCSAPPAAPPLADPLYPSPPRPPRPPVISNPMLTPVARWERRTQLIPAGYVPVWSNAVPVLDIDNTHGSLLRLARIRFYANPFGFAMRDLDPCEFCGDFLIAYIPAGAVFTLDGQSQRASVLLPGGQTVDATHLLFGTDGRPFQWPVLSCGTMYYMTFDVPWDPDTQDQEGLEFHLRLAGRD